MRQTHLLLLLLALMLVAAPVAAAKTTQVQVIRYASDGTTVANQTTVDVAWMESHLPVFGDGTTPYLFQGPVLDVAASDPAKWNPAEDKNVDKVNETIKGTNLVDLCNLVGGMQPGGEVKVVASDGFARTFAYDNVYTPQARQGPMVLAWWTAREGYAYQDGIRLFFGADASTNPYGLHVFGHQDMRETFDEKYWGWYGGVGNYPSAAQLSNKWVAKVAIFPAPASDWTLFLNGSIKRDITKSYFESGLSWSGHRASYTDATGTWEGMPLWRLVGYVDDGNEHTGASFNDTLAAMGYTVRVIAGDGFSRTFTSQEIAENSNYIVANTLNGSALPVQINGKNVWPLKLVGVNATGGKSVGNITEIRLEGVPITVTTPTPTPTTTPIPSELPWTLQMTGYTNFTVTNTYFAEGMACGGHTGTYTDANGVEWMGMPLWRLVGLVDDQLGHEVYIGAYNETLADIGYNITVIAGDGFSRTFTSREAKRSPDYLVASRMNGSALPMQINGKNVWPLKLVGANATGGKSVGNITEIRLTDLPIAPPVTPTPTPTPPGGQTVLFDGNLTLRDGTFAAFAYNSNATHQVQNLTPHGALELAARAANFTYDATDKKWETMGTFLLDNAGGFDYDKTGNRVWAYRVNGAKKNDFSSTEGISVYRLADNDLVEFYYGVQDAAFANAQAVIRARVQIRQQTTVYDGPVTLTNGTFAAYAYNSGATYPVKNLTVHGALEAAARAGNFTYNATDKKWSSLGTLLLDGVAGIDFNKTENTAWAYTLNGVPMNDFSADQGISVQPVGNGDQIVLYFGVKGAPIDEARAVVRIRVFVASESDFALSLVGARTASFTRADFDASPDRTTFTDVSGTWSGIPLWRLAGLVDDGDAASFNDGLAATNYTVKVIAADGYNKSLGSAQMARSGDYVVADRLNGAPLPETMWPLRLVGAAVPPHMSVAKLATVQLLVPATPTPTPTTTPYKPLVVPGRIEAEDYDIGGFHDTTPGNEGGVYRTDDVDIEYTAAEKSYNVGWIRNGEWLSYTATVQQAGAYTMKARVASPYDGQQATLIVDGATGPTIAIPKTGAYETFTTVEVPVTLAAGTHVLKLFFSGDGQNLNYVEFVTAGVTPTPTTTPYKPLVVPGRIEAEDYDIGGFHDTTPGNEGGVYRTDDVDIEYTAAEKSYNVGWIRNGEWLSYTATVQQAGAYTMTARVASPNSGRTAALLIDGVQAATIAVPKTGSFESFSTVTVPVTLSAGVHVLKLSFSGDGQNLNWLEFSSGTITVPTTPAPGGASFTAAPNPVAKSAAIKFTLVPAAGKSVASAWWTFDRQGHYGTWNSRDQNPTFFYPTAGTYTPLVKITYTDGSTETVERLNYVTVK